MSDFWPFQPTAGGIFDSGDLQSIGLRVAQKENFEKKFFGNVQKTSKLCKNIFWASSDHVVGQKSIFWKKIFEKVTISGNPPPFSYMRDICSCIFLVIFSSKHTKGIAKLRYKIKELSDQFDTHFYSIFFFEFINRNNETLEG